MILARLPLGGVNNAFDTTRRETAARRMIVFE